MSDTEDAEERTSPSGKVVYQAIFKEGSDELDRSSSALAWSGLAAGLSMGFSFVGVGLIKAFLPDAPWVPLVSSSRQAAPVCRRLPSEATSRSTAHLPGVT